LIILEGRLTKVLSLLDILSNKMAVREPTNDVLFFYSFAGLPTRGVQKIFFEPQRHKRIQKKWLNHERKVHKRYPQADYFNEIQSSEQLRFPDQQTALFFRIKIKYCWSGEHRCSEDFLNHKGTKEHKRSGQIREPIISTEYNLPTVKVGRPTTEGIASHCSLLTIHC
jgi:hypothetical protein